MEMLTQGGNVIYLRHATTDKTRPDADPVDLSNCSMQRPLSKEGREQARNIGLALRGAGVKIDRVLTSPYCRAIDTAELAFPDASRRPIHALAYSLALPKDEAARAAAEVKRLLGTTPAAGTNLLLVGHTSNLKEAAGVWPHKEGGAMVFHPDGKGHFDFVGALDPSAFEKKHNHNS
jgi:phosphohistidine phosphatase SixA